MNTISQQHFATRVVLLDKFALASAQFTLLATEQVRQYGWISVFKERNSILQQTLYHVKLKQYILFDYICVCSSLPKAHSFNKLISATGLATNNFFCSTYKAKVTLVKICYVINKEAQNLDFTHSMISLSDWLTTNKPHSKV